MRRRGDDSVEVVLDDLAGDRPAHGAGDPRPARRRRRRLVGAGLLVLVGVAVVSAVMTAEDGRRERDRREALADVPGLLPSLDGPLEEAWSVDDARLAALGRDVVVLLAPRDGRLTGVDLRTGGRVWTHPSADDETCRTLGPQSAPGRWAVGPDPVELVACYRFFATVEGSRVVVGAPAVVTVLDVETGAEVATVPTPADVLGVELAAPDVVIASLDQQGAVVVSRWALPGTPGTPAREVWTRRVPEPLESIDRTGWVFHVEGEVLRVGTVGSVPLDLATGEPRPDAAREGVLYTLGATLPGGARVEWDVDRRAFGIGVSRVVPAGDGDVVELEGVPWLPDVTDGSEPGVLLLRRLGQRPDVPGGSGDIVAVDPVSGADLWSGDPMAGMEPLVQVDGILVTAGAGTVVALDVRSGDVVWQDAVDGVGVSPAALTDGDVVVVTERAGPELALVARDLGTGVERWRTSLGVLSPDGVTFAGSGAGVLASYRDRVALLVP